MKPLRSALIIVIPLWFALRCSAIGPAQPLEPALDAPPRLRALSADRQRVVDANDFRLRDRSRGAIRLVAVRAPAPDGLPPALAAVASLKLERALKTAGVSLLYPEANAPDLSVATDASREYLKRVDADAVALIKLVAEGPRGRGQLEVALLDAYNGQELARLNQEVEYDAAPAAPDRQADFVQRRDGAVALLSSVSVPVVRLKNVNANAMQEFARKAVTGFVSVFSSAADAEIVSIQDSRRESLGRAPLTARPLLEGRYVLSVKRPGYEEARFPVQVRAGRTDVVFVPWPDDRNNSSLAMLSSPPNQRVSLDGAVRGQTPLYLTGLDAGSYQLELSRAKSSGDYVITAESPLEIAGGDALSRLFLINYDEDFGADLLDTDFWQLASEAGPVSFEPGQGLAFRSSESRSSAWLGLMSRPVFLADDFDIRLQARSSEGGALLVGLLNERAHTVLLRMESRTYTLQRFDGERMLDSPLTFTTLRKREGDLHEIRYRYNKKENLLEVRLDGSLIFEGAWNGGPFARIILTTRPVSADGRSLAAGLSVRTGPGLYD